MGESKLVAADKIAATQQPTGEAGFDGMADVAGGGLLCLNKDQLVMADQRRAKFHACVGEAAEVADFKGRPGPADLHDGFIERHLSVKGCGAANKAVGTDHGGLDHFPTGQAYDHRNDARVREMDH